MNENDAYNEGERVKTYQIPLLLGLCRCSGVLGSAFGLVLAVGLCLGNLTWRCLAAPPPSPPLSPPLGPLLVFLFGGFGDFDDDSAAVKLLLVEGGDSLFGGVEGSKGDEAIASRTGSALDDLSGEAVAKGQGEETGRGERRTDISVAADSKKALRPSLVVE